MNSSHNSDVVMRYIEKQFDNHCFKASYVYNIFDLYSRTINFLNMFNCYLILSLFLNVFLLFFPEFSPYLGYQLLLDKMANEKKKGGGFFLPPALF